MSTIQPSIGGPLQPGSTTHSKYSFAKTPRFPSSNPMYQFTDSDAHRLSTHLIPNFRKERLTSAMAKRFSLPASCLTLLPLIVIASILASSKQKDLVLVLLARSLLTVRTWCPSSTSTLDLEKYLILYSVLKPGEDSHESRAIDAQ